MDALEDGEAQAREIQRDIERTREEMDQTLTELEQRLAPSEILHQGAETVRAGVRTRAVATLDALKRHPAPIVLAAALLGARFAFRPSATDRRRRQAQEDVDRAWTLLGVAFERAKDQSQLGAAKLGALGRDVMNDPGGYAGPALRTLEELARLTGARTWSTMQRATEESRAMTRALRREAGVNPLGALMLLGVGVGVSMLAARGSRAR